MPVNFLICVSSQVFTSSLLFYINSVSNSPLFPLFAIFFYLRPNFIMHHCFSSDILFHVVLGLPILPMTRHNQPYTCVRLPKCVCMCDREWVCIFQCISIFFGRLSKTQCWCLHYWKKTQNQCHNFVYTWFPKIPLAVVLCVSYNLVWKKLV